MLGWFKLFIISISYYIKSKQLCFLIKFLFTNFSAIGILFYLSNPQIKNLPLYTSPKVP